VSEPQRVTIELGDRSYDILIGSGLLDDAGRHLATVLPSGRAFIVSDKNVAPLHLPALETSLKSAGIAYHSKVVAAGEASKDFRTLEQLLDAMLAERIERSTTVIALGGGVVGDLAGFASAIVMRGTALVQIPTTLLAQVDSSVGGKTGINTARGKNLIGAFHQPRLVLADSDVLATLPSREMQAGYAEIVKHGLIADAPFFGWLEDNGRAVLIREPGAVAHAVATSCRIKAAIVAEDEREAGRRALLNLGHTFGHALEAEAGYGRELLHGEAVGIGLVLAARLSARLGHCGPEIPARIARHLAATGLAADLPGQRTWDPARLLEHMRLDKKVRNGRLRFVLLRDIGDAFLSDDVPIGAVDAILGEAAAA